jgi:hypothetical protein
MFKFLPATALPGFRVGLPDGDELGFSVPTDGSTPSVLPGAADAPTVDDNYPFRATPLSFNVPQVPSPNRRCIAAGYESGESGAFGRPEDTR